MELRLHTKKGDLRIALSMTSKRLRGDPIKEETVLCNNNVIVYSSWRTLFGGTTTSPLASIVLHCNALHISYITLR